MASLLGWRNQYQYISEGISDTPVRPVFSLSENYSPSLIHSQEYADAGCYNKHRNNRKQDIVKIIPTALWILQNRLFERRHFLNLLFQRGFNFLKNDNVQLNVLLPWVGLTQGLTVLYCKPDDAYVSAAAVYHRDMSLTTVGQLKVGWVDALSVARVSLRAFTTQVGTIEYSYVGTQDVQNSIFHTLGKFQWNFFRFIITFRYTEKRLNFTGKTRDFSVKPLLNFTGNAMQLYYISLIFMFKSRFHLTFTDVSKDLEKFHWNLYSACTL